MYPEFVCVLFVCSNFWSKLHENSITDAVDRQDRTDLISAVIDPHLDPKPGFFEGFFNIARFIFHIIYRAGFSLSRALFRKKCGAPPIIYESPD